MRYKIMNLLPNDVLEKIYFEKHKLEMEDVFQIIRDKKVNHFENILSELEYNLRNDPDIAYDILKINIALRNDGYINDLELKYRLVNLNEYLHIFFKNTHTNYNEIDIDLEMSTNLWTSTDELI